MPHHLAIKTALSTPRMGTYVAATTQVPSLPGAVALYTWNAQVSAAFMHLLHLCEVVIRNAVSEALSASYGPRWPWDNGFLLSLPHPANSKGLRLRDTVTAAAAKAEFARLPGSLASTDKAIAEMSFAFWEAMFTQRHDAGLWAARILTLFPNAPSRFTFYQLRSRIYGHLRTLRKLRNRIAHHEPIFARPLGKEFLMIDELIRFRCIRTADWMMRTQEVQRLLRMRPA